MTFKSLLFTALFLFSTIFVFSQRDPNKEILVYFVNGVSQQSVNKNNETLKVAEVTDTLLKASLNKIGISETMLEVALPDFNINEASKILRNGRQVKQIDMSKLYRISVSEDKNRDDIISSLIKLPEVLYAEPNGLVSPNVIPSDTRFIQQWGLRNTVNIGNDIHAEQAWDIYTGNPNNIIGIIDGGTDAGHPDLNDKISGGDTGNGWGGHGVHVSGIAAAETNNTQGVSGVD